MDIYMIQLSIMVNELPNEGISLLLEGRIFTT